MKMCDNCRFWSQMIAQSIGLLGVEALCLSSVSPHSRKFTKAHKSCPAWRENTHGAVDEPPDYGEMARALYDTEENTEQKVNDD
jgi:hypothetical protein